MTPCRNCGEDVGDESVCPNCGRRQYRYAIEDDSTTEPERTEALEDVADLLAERMRPPPVRREEQREWQPPREWDYGSAPKSEPLPRIQGSETRRGVGCLLFFFLFGFGAFWFFLVLGTVSEGGDGAGASIFGGVLLSVIPALIILGLLRRWRQQR